MTRIHPTQSIQTTGHCPAMAQMSEDDIYRTSTQYRLWSFTRESLASLRSTTNASAADGVRAAIQSQRASQATSDTAHDEKNFKRPDPTKEVDCLTVEEEQKLVGFYCVKAMQFADFCEFPTNVKVGSIYRCCYSLTNDSRLRQYNISNASTCPTPQ